MKTPFLDIVKKSFIDLNGGFRYFPMDTETPKVEQPKTQSITKAPAPDLPAILEDTQRARGVTSKHAPKGPQATPMTSSRDNVAFYRSKGVL